jgi:hypothetical protein
MKNSAVIVIIMSLCFAFSCEIEKSEKTKPVNPGVMNISDSGCKNFDSKCTRNEDCVIYETINDSCLRFQRINVPFNCCIDSVLVSIEADNNNMIRITERENAGYCDCVCLYDIEYTIGPLNYGLYSIIIDEEYLFFMHENSDTISFDINFNKQTQGEYCIERPDYVWLAE